jgi:redox-sensitive bicupin YhaK (pirin superfamily)
MTRTAHERITWDAPSAPVGHLTVLRPVPNAMVEAVGPIVFLDHFGPIPTPADKLPAHPHAGIEVLTYLLEGANEHTDSLGNTGRIAAGGAQWMKAGRGVLHAERFLPDEAPTTHGLQVWARLPLERQDDATDYRAIHASDVPRWSVDGGELRLLAGALDGRTGPIPLALPTLLVHASIDAGGALEIELPSAGDPAANGSGHEHGVYGITAPDRVTVDGQDELRRGTTVRLESGATAVRLANDGSERAEVFLFGGQAAPRPLLFGGPFVYDTRAGLVEANRRFHTGEMGTLDGVPR